MSRNAKEMNILLDAYAKGSQMPNLDMVLDLFDSHRVDMDKFSFGLLLTAAYRSNANMATIDRIIDEMIKR